LCRRSAANSIGARAGSPEEAKADRPRPATKT
jgi:hypothetical protein